MGKLRIVAAAAVGFAPLAFGVTVVAGPPALADTTPSCSPAGTTGLTASVVASAGQRIEGRTVDAGGCDIGIYVGPGVDHVVIDGVAVTGANDHGIFVQDTSHVTIENSTVEGNGVDPTAHIAENKGIELVGTTNSIVRDDTVAGNLADGGNGIADDGPIDPGAPNPGTLLASSNDVVTGNTVFDNYVGCGIVVAAYDAGGGVFDNLVEGNSVTGSPLTFGAEGPVIGGIVVAADAPGTTVANNSVVHNTDTGSFIPGIVVHSNAPGDVVSGNVVVANTLAADGWGKVDVPGNTAAMVGVVVGAGSDATLSDTTVAANRITGEDDGVFISGATGTHLGGLPLDQAATAVVTLP